MNPIPNKPSPPIHRSPLEILKKKFIRLKKHESPYEVVKGIFLGTWTTAILNPGLYVVNMVTSGHKVVWRNSMRGVMLNGATVVPQTMVQMTVFRKTKELFFPNQKQDKIQLVGLIFCSAMAGGVSGFLTNPAEMVLLQYQKQLSLEYNARQIFLKVWNDGGLLKCQVGGSGTIAREMIWAASYLTLAPAASSVFGRVFSDQYAKDLCGATTTGAIAGLLTNPANVLRVRKQNEVFSKTPRSYVQIIREEGMKELFRGYKQRMAVVSFACILMTGGGWLIRSIE